MGFNSRTYHQPYADAKAELDAIKVDQTELMPLLNSVFSLVNARIEQNTKQKKPQTQEILNKENEALQALHMSLINIQSAAERKADPSIIINSLYQNLLTYTLLIRQNQGNNNDFTLAISKFLDKLNQSEKYTIEKPQNNPAHFLTVSGIHSETTKAIKERMFQKAGGLYHSFKQKISAEPQIVVSPPEDKEGQVDFDFSFQKPGLRSLMGSLLNTYRSLSSNLAALSTAYAHTNLLTQNQIITNTHFSKASKQLVTLNAAFINILTRIPNLNEQCMINKGLGASEAMHFDLNEYRDLLAKQLSPEIAYNPEEQEALLESLQLMLKKLVKLITEYTYVENGFEGNIFAHELADKPELKGEFKFLLEQFLNLTPPVLASMDSRYGRLMSLYNDLRNHDAAIRSAMENELIPAQVETIPEPSVQDTFSNQLGRFANYVVGSFGVASAISSGLGSFAWNQKALGQLTSLAKDFRDHARDLQNYFSQQDDISQTVVPAVIQRFSKNFDLSAMQNVYAIYSHTVEHYLGLASKPGASALENVLALIEMEPTGDMTPAQLNEIKKGALFNFIELLHEANQALSGLTGLLNDLSELKAYMNYDPETKVRFEPILKDIEALKALLNEQPNLLTEFKSVAISYIESKIQKENIQLPDSFPNTENYPEYMRNENPLMLLSRELGALTKHAGVIATLDINTIMHHEDVNEPITFSRSRSSSQMSTGSNSNASTGAGSESGTPSPKSNSPKLG